ncbi:MAG: hypothetical protein JXB88_14680 [Spirochaetales bacterium]|nr:hypothetical protein [Spirochaetales bacterium]
MEFSKKEKKIANLLSRFPGLKKIIKYTYQSINYLAYRPKDKIVLHPAVSIKRIGADDKGSFFGYFQHSPDLEGRILYHQFDKKTVQKQNIAFIDIFLDNTKISETNSWNWQQGGMVNWTGKHCIAHNYYDSGYKCRIIDAKNNTVKTIPYPFYSFFPDGNSFLTLNFKRLARVSPAYGYFNESTRPVCPYDPDDGIVKIEINDYSKKLLISFQELTALKPKETMKNSWHWVNHINIAPDGNRFMFFHRWYIPGGGIFSRLISANKEGKDLFILADDDMVSHCCWKDNQTIIGWFRKKGIGDNYYHIRDKSGEFSMLNNTLLKQDGHPGISKNKQWLLTDTYPDKSRMSTLLLYNIKEDKIIPLGSFFSPLKYSGEYRCDLHPRFSRDNKSVFIDSVYEGTRHLYQIDIAGLMNG